MGADRAGQRERLGGPAHDRAARRRRLGPRRHQDVHHAGLGRRLLRGARAHEPRRAEAAGDHGVRRRARDAGVHGLQAPAQARVPLERHRGAHPRERARPRRAARRRAWTAASPTPCASSTAGASPSPRWRSASATARSRRPSSYAKERKAFGKPIAEFQAIQWMLADAKTELDAAVAAHVPRGLARRRGRAALERGGDGQAVRQRGGHAGVQHAPSRSTAATGTSASSTSSGTCATRSSARSARGPARSSAWSSPSTSSG